MIFKITQIRNLQNYAEDPSFTPIPGQLAYVMQKLDRYTNVSANWSTVFKELKTLGLPNTAVVPEQTASARGIALIADPKLFPALPIVGVDTVSLPFKVNATRHRLAYSSVGGASVPSTSIDMVHGGNFGPQSNEVEFISEQLAPFNLTNFGRPISYSPLENLSSTNPTSNVNDLPLYRKNSVKVPGGNHITTSVIRGIANTDTGTRSINRMMLFPFSPIQMKDNPAVTLNYQTHYAFLISEYEVEVDNSLMQKATDAASKIYAIWNTATFERCDITTAPDTAGNRFGVALNAINMAKSTFNCVAVNNLQGGVYREAANTGFIDIRVDTLSTPDPTEIENRLSVSINTGPLSEVPRTTF